MVRQSGLCEVDQQLRALLSNIDTGRSIGQLNDYTSFTVLATTESDVTDGMLVRGRFRLGKMSHLALDRVNGNGRRQGDQQVLAVKPDVRCRGLIQVHHQARLFRRLDQIHAAQQTFVEGLAVTADSICRRRKVNCQSCRVGHAETRQDRTQRLLQR